MGSVQFGRIADRYWGTVSEKRQSPSELALIQICDQI